MGVYIIYAFLIFMVIAVALTNWNGWRERQLEKKEYEQQQASAGRQQATSGSGGSSRSVETTDLFLDTLTKIGCQYTLCEGDDNRIYFSFQGERFMAITQKGIKYACIWDPNWTHAELDDIDEVSRLRKAINTSNISTYVDTVFTIDEEEKTMDVHSKSTILFIPSIPDLDDYLCAELDRFFRAHQVLGNEMHKLREKELNA